MNKAVIFDLDGTIYYGNTLAYYALEAIKLLEDSGYTVIFFTNNSTKTRKEICNKLICLNVKTEVAKVYTSSYATGKYLKESTLKKVFLIGTESFAQELASFNIEVVDEYSCEAVVVGLDTNFTYNTIAKGLIAICNGSKIIASNADANFPVENGICKPGANAILASLIGASNHQVHYIVGKPNTYLLETICKEWNLHKENIWVIGDMVESDIAMANHYGCRSVLVGRDEKTLEDAIKIILGDCQ